MIILNLSSEAKIRQLLKWTEDFNKIKRYDKARAEN